MHTNSLIKRISAFIFFSAAPALFAATLTFIEPPKYESDATQYIRMVTVCKDRCTPLNPIIVSEKMQPKLDAFIRALQSTDENKRFKALKNYVPFIPRMFSRFSIELFEATPYLYHLYKNGTGREKQLALLILAKFHPVAPKWVEQVLKEAAASEDVNLRITAYEGMGFTEAEPSIFRTEIKKGLNDAEPKVVGEAVLLTDYSTDNDYTSQLLGLLKHTNKRVRIQATAALWNKRLTAEQKNSLVQRYVGLLNAVGEPDYLKRIAFRGLDQLNSLSQLKKFISRELTSGDPNRQRKVLDLVSRYSTHSTAKNGAQIARHAYNEIPNNEQRAAVQLALTEAMVKTGQVKPVLGMLALKMAERPQRTLVEVASAYKKMGPLQELFRHHLVQVPARDVDGGRGELPQMLIETGSKELNIWMANRPEPFYREMALLAISQQKWRKELSPAELTDIVSAKPANAIGTLAAQVFFHLSVDQDQKAKEYFTLMGRLHVKGWWRSEVGYYLVNLAVAFPKRLSIPPEILADLFHLKGSGLNARMAYARRLEKPEYKKHALDNITDPYASRAYLEAWALGGPADQTDKVMNAIHSWDVTKRRLVYRQMVMLGMTHSRYIQDSGWDKKIATWEAPDSESIDSVRRILAAINFSTWEEADQKYGIQKSTAGPAHQEEE